MFQIVKLPTCKLNYEATVAMLHVIIAFGAIKLQFRRKDEDTSTAD